MKKIQKHEFEPVSLLTVENGVLELAVIPARNQPDWLVPKSLILAIEPYDERIWTYLWKQSEEDSQEIMVYHLIDRQVMPDKLVILEGNTDVHRLALQTAGKLDYVQARISDVKDVDLPEEVKQLILDNIPGLSENEGHKLEFLYQTVTIGEEMYIVPDLDLIAHRLVDLDG